LLDNGSYINQTFLMSQSTRKFIAVLLAIWLPLFSGSVLAASVTMQLHNGTGPYAAMQGMQNGDACEQQHTMSADGQNHSVMPDHHGKSCTTCGVCHLACSSYLAVSSLDGLAVHQADDSVVFYVLSFNSISSVPLLPPPLARV
jgi:hypothetical protein